MKAILTSLLAVAVAMTASDASAQKAAEPAHWITTWTASPMNTQPSDSVWLGFYDQTVREVARLTACLSRDRRGGPLRRGRLGRSRSVVGTRGDGQLWPDAPRARHEPRLK